MRVTESRAMAQADWSWVNSSGAVWALTGPASITSKASNQKFAFLDLIYLKYSNPDPI